jgi:hypothetical protein
MRKTVIIGISALLAVLAMPTASALDNTTLYFVPQNVNASSCGDTVVQVMAHAPYGINGVYWAINYKASCIKVVDVEFNSNWWYTGWNISTKPECWGPGHDWLQVWRDPDLGPGDVWICNITINCTDPNCDYCKSHLNIACGLDCINCGFDGGNNSGALPFNATNGTFTCGIQPAGVCGDVTGDGHVRVSDGIRIISNQTFVGDPRYFVDPWAADVNCDGFVRVSDGIRIISNQTFVGDPRYFMDCC